ncbi:MAG: DUF354 domain-containing protein [Balneolaceae bacterium]
MSLLFDIKHIAHVNFFKPVIHRLVKENYKVIISYIDRGRLPKIIKAEFPYVDSYSIGAHRGNTISILYDANFKKFFKGSFLIKEHDIQLMLGVDAFVTGLSCKLFGIPNIQFYDDPERKVNLFLEQKTSSELFYPAITDFSGTSVQTYNALKEWAYLSPTQFIPNEKVLKEYELKKANYFFVREVDNGSLNYKGQDSGTIASVAESFPTDIPVILSLENKSKKESYPSNWIILDEPIMDIHSLMYFSKAVISSGDSMAREGAMLGVPSFYVGFRDMAANRFIQKEGRFYIVSPEHLSKGLTNLGIEENSKEEYREYLQNKWIDVTDMIYQLIIKYLKN